MKNNDLSSLKNFKTNTFGIPKMKTPLDIMVGIEKMERYKLIEEELEHAQKKHPNFPKDMFKQLAIMQEEAGEVTKAVLHFHYENGTIEHVREELIQTAAMCVRMLENLE